MFEVSKMQNFVIQFDGRVGLAGVSDARHGRWKNSIYSFVRRLISECRRTQNGNSVDEINSMKSFSSSSMSLLTPPFLPTLQSPENVIRYRIALLTAQPSRT